MSETPVETVAIKDSILASTKKALNIHDENVDFDVDITMHINAVLNALTQIGVGPGAGFMIEDRSTRWVDFLGTDTRLNAVKALVPLKVRLAFDPPGTSFHIASLEELIKEYTWRLNVTADTATVTSSDDDLLVWIIDDTEPFPEDADEGDVGISLDSGDVWRKV